LKQQKPKEIGSHSPEEALDTNTRLSKGMTNRSKQANRQHKIREHCITSLCYSLVVFNQHKSNWNMFLMYI